MSAPAASVFELPTPEGFVDIRLSPDNHALLSDLLATGIARLAADPDARARIRRLAGACRVDSDRIWGER